MVGDGINDSVALASSDIAVSIKGGADVTIEVSDVIILNNKLSGLAKSINISQKTFKIIKENLAISLGYNMITIPLAMMGYVVPFVAAISMSVSSLLVVGNSMRIKKIK
jgi:Cu+-exporting ATPase